MEAVKNVIDLTLYILVGIPIAYTAGEWWQRQFDRLQEQREAKHRRDYGKKES